MAVARSVRRVAPGVPAWIALVRLAVVALAAASPADAAVERFYLELERRGVEEHSSGDAATAGRHLTVACFGMLEEPAARGRCLAHLALALADAGDRRSFLAAFGKLLEVERGYQGYTRAILDRRVREALAGRVEAWVPAERLAGVAVFAEVRERREAHDVAALPLAERRAEVARRRDAQPEAASWAVLAGELALLDRKPTEALAAVSPVLGRDPGNAGARCVRGRVLAQRGSCADARTDLDACAGPFDVDAAGDILVCALADGDLARAAEVLAALPEEAKRRDPIRKHQRELRRRIEAGERVAAEPATVEPATPEVAPPASVGGLSSADAVTLAQAREALASSSRATLEPAYESARGLADRNPSSVAAQHLAAELAYRLARWSEAVALFRRGGDPNGGRPELLFYLAVALYESGDAGAAAVPLEAALPRMARTPFVESYVKKILGDGGAGGGR